jgi:hypothetical protein
MKAAVRGTRQAHEMTRRASVAGWCLNSAKKMVPSTATPSEADSCCEASMTPAADPASFMLTAARMNCMSWPSTMPTPAPTSSRPGTRSQVEALSVPVSIRASAMVPAAMNTMPMCSNWRPSRLTSMPDTSMPTIMPATIGVRVRPAWIGDHPSPSWPYSDTQSSSPPKAPNRDSMTAIPLRYMRLANRDGSIKALRLRRRS